jgi:hypothetical protein
MLLRVPTKHCLPIIEDPLDHTLLSWSKARRQCGTGALPNSHASDDRSVGKGMEREQNGNASAPTL